MWICLFINNTTIEINELFNQDNVYFSGEHFTFFIEEYQRLGFCKNIKIICVKKLCEIGKEYREFVIVFNQL